MNENQHVQQNPKNEQWHIVLDLDHTLIKSELMDDIKSMKMLRALYRSWNSEDEIFFIIIGDMDKLRDTETPDSAVSEFELFRIHIRPHALKLLSTLKKHNFHTSIWTAALASYGQQIAHKLSAITKLKFQNIWTRDDCFPIVTPKGSTRYTKPLAKFFCQPKVLLIDDSPYSGWSNLDHWLPISRYDANKNDNNMIAVCGLITMLYKNPKWDSLMHVEDEDEQRVMIPYLQNVLSYFMNQWKMEDMFRSEIQNQLQKLKYAAHV